MPTYRIREYYSYYDEYEVDAPDLMTAEELSNRFIQGDPVTSVEQVEDHVYDDYLDTMRYEVGVDGTVELID